MNTFTASIPALVTAKAAGVEITMNLEEFDATSIEAIVTYGARRMLQDAVNAQAHVAKKEGVDFDAEAAVEARVEAFRTGSLSVRTGTGDPLDPYRIQATRAAVNNNPEGKNAKKLASFGDDRKAADAWLLELGKANAEAIDAIARDLKAIAEERAATKRAVSL